ncbi:PTS sugar transporter subunit IIC [Enterococcus ureasiticus]|uniref:Permease IIC component n=1 Tax=Enterococcus ureasiticus TaxID=903984 RepID=A0A1E5GA83_9ENTE|nr:PTS transporter subunit EIIC [Enterococcus ureasiticus]OEG09603.1 PTS lactose transporter subunit IIC [Enterococcus ureasiticus]
MNFIETKLLPVLLKVGNNKHLIAIRNGISMTIPFTIIGSFFLIIGNFPIKAWTDLIEPWSNLLNAPVNVTFGVLGLISAIGIGYHLGKELGTDPISNSLLTTIGFLLATTNNDLSVNIDALGASGMFTAIVIGIFVTHSFRYFVKKNIVIKMPEGVPPTVAMSFTTLIPGAFVLIVIWVLRCLFGIDLNALISYLFQPLVSGMGTLPGMLIYTTLVCLLWICGIHGDNILSGIATPVFLGYLAENTHAFQNGVQAQNIIAEGYWIVFMCIGGTGATLGLVLNMIRSKSKMYKSIGELSLPSAIFCINEPVIFGLPIVMNPIMIIPFIGTPVILCIGTYILMSMGIIGKIVIQVPWTIPPVIGAYIATNGNIGAAIWSIISIAISYIIYMPFFKMMETQQLKNEAESTE